METVIVTFQAALVEVVHHAIDTALKEQLPHIIRRAITKAYLTKPELMELTGWSSRQVEYKKSKREIPFVRQGRLVLFPTEEVFAYLDNGLVPARTSK